MKNTQVLREKLGRLSYSSSKNLTKEMNDLYNENIKHGRMKVKKVLEDGETSQIH
jgi:hypothetical protein